MGGTDSPSGAKSCLLELSSVLLRKRKKVGVGYMGELV